MREKDKIHWLSTDYTHPNGSTLNHGYGTKLLMIMFGSLSLPPSPTRNVPIGDL